MNVNEIADGIYSIMTTCKKIDKDLPYDGAVDERWRNRLHLIDNELLALLQAIRAISK